MMPSIATASGERVATPSTKVAADSVVTTVPCSNDRSVDGARSDTTPTIRVSSPSRSRTAINALMPEPMPTGT